MLKYLSNLKYKQAKATKLKFPKAPNILLLVSLKFYFLLLNIRVSRKGFRILNTCNVLSSLRNNFEAPSNMSAEEPVTSGNMTI